MKRAFVLGAAALVASCVFAQDVFAQHSDSRVFGEGGYRAPPGYVGRPRLRVVVRPGLRRAGWPRLIYYPYSDRPYVPVGTPPFLSCRSCRKDRQLLGLGQLPVAELLRKILPRVLVGAPGIQRGLTASARAWPAAPQPDATARSFLFVPREDHYRDGEGAEAGGLTHNGSSPGSAESEPLTLRASCTAHEGELKAKD
jgi:hypothetical protein